MSAVPVPIPENLLSVVNLLTTLAATEPIIADHVGPILVQMFDYAMTSGKVKDPDVWIRALKGAIVTVETMKADDVWLSRLPVERGE